MTAKKARKGVKRPPAKRTPVKRSQAKAAIFLLSVRLPEIRAERGDTVAGRVLDQLSELAGRGLEKGDRLAPAGEDALLLELSGGAARARLFALKLEKRLRVSHRFPVRVGLGTGRADAEAAARAANDSGVWAVDNEGRATPIEGDGGPSEPPLSASLGARYQRLVLLNRMTHDVYSDAPFEHRIANACNFALALTDARHAAVYFTDAFGAPSALGRRGDRAFLSDEAVEEELVAVERARKLGHVAAHSGRWGWLAAPMTSASSPVAGDIGAVVLGFYEPPSDGGERGATLGEIAKHLRSARLIQLNLEQSGTMAAVAEQSTDSIVVTDLEGRITSWNPSAEALFGWKEQEALGRSVELVVPEENRAESDALRERTIETGSSVNVETVRLRRDGSLVPVEMTMKLLRDESGRAFGLVRVARDITKRKEVERMKNELVAMVSHELRTPLTAIQGFAETLSEYAEDMPPEKSRTYLKIILDESERLGKLVTNFLDLSRIEAGAAAPKLQTMDLEPLFARAAALFEEDPSGARVKPSIEPDAAKVRGDGEQIYRVLVNLCSNAIKYSPKGGSVELTARGVDGFVEVWVRDHGPGIPPDRQTKLFEKFYRVPEPASSGRKGTGLGLAICKSVVESHGGRIWVDSEPGHGATFKFTIPK